MWNSIASMQNLLAYWIIWAWHSNFVWRQLISVLKYSVQKLFKCSKIRLMQHSKILIIWHLKGIIPRWKFCFLQEETSSLREGDVSNMFKQVLIKSVCVSTVPVSLTLYLLLHQLLQLGGLQKTRKSILMTLNQQKKIFKWSTPITFSAKV
jgi:hypothetical protein